jgi:hypothetical protein
MTTCVSYVGLILFIVTYRESDGEADLIFRCHAENETHAREQAINAYPDCVIVKVGVLNERYAESIMGDDPTRYDATEVLGVRDLHAAGSPDGTCCEVDEEDPEFYSAYAHCRAGGVECIGDFGTRAMALAYAREIDSKYQLPLA